MPLKYVGVASAAQNNEILKRAALLCDEVVCNGVVGDARRAVELGIVRTALRTELEAAFAKIPTSDVPDAERALNERKADVEAILSQIHRDVDEMSAVVNEATKSKLSEQANELLRRSVTHLGELTSEFGDLWTRFHAEIMRFSAGDNLYLPVLYHSRMLDTGVVARARVIRVVFEALPLPTVETPWEAINDWRCDPEASEKYRLLRAWISRFARENPSSADIEEELASSLATYQRYMAIQHTKMQRTRFEAVVLPIAEMAEDALHLRLSKAASKLFALFKDETTLLESELAAPGREVAYITASQTRFGHRAG